MELELIDFDVMLLHLCRLGAAFLLALPIAWDRERSARESLGLRTFPLVAVASCGFMVVGQTLAAGDASAIARILQGLITGVGFLGGGAIVKRGLDVHGAATAASIWTTACIGAAAAFDRYEIALVLSIITFLALNWLKAAKPMVENGDSEPEDASGRS